MELVKASYKIPRLLWIICVSCVCHAFATVHCCLVVTCRQRLNSWLMFVMDIVILLLFPFGILGQMLYLVVSIPDPCCLSYFNNTSQYKIGHHWR